MVCILIRAGCFGLASLTAVLPVGGKVSFTFFRFGPSQKIPVGKRWSKCWRESLEHPIGIDAFEFGGNHGDEIFSEGMSNATGYLPIAAKSLMTKAAPGMGVDEQKSGDHTGLSRGAGQYIELQEDYRYNSALYFTL